MNHQSKVGNVALIALESLIISPEIIAVWF